MQLLTRTSEISSEEVFRDLLITSLKDVLLNIPGFST